MHGKAILKLIARLLLGALALIVLLVVYGYLNYQIRLRAELKYSRIAIGMPVSKAHEIFGPPDMVREVDAPFVRWPREHGPYREVRYFPGGPPHVLGIRFYVDKEDRIVDKELVWW